MIDQQAGIHVGMEEQHMEHTEQPVIVMDNTEHMEHIEVQHIEPIEEQHIEPIEEQHTEPIEEQHTEPIEEQHIEHTEEHMEEHTEQHMEQYTEQPSVVVPPEHTEQYMEYIEEPIVVIVPPEQHMEQPAVVVPPEYIEEHMEEYTEQHMEQHMEQPAVVVPPEHTEQYMEYIEEPTVVIIPPEQHMEQPAVVVPPEYIEEHIEEPTVVIVPPEQQPVIEEQPADVIVPPEQQPIIEEHPADDVPPVQPAVVVIIDDDDNDVMVIDIVQAADNHEEQEEQFEDDFDAVVDQPAADQPAADQPAADQPAADQPAAVLPVQNVYNQGQFVPHEVGQVIIQQAVTAAASAAAIIVPEVIPPPGINIVQLPVQVPVVAVVPGSSMSSISKQWVPEPDAFVYFSEISNVSENKVLNAWSSQAAQVAKSMLDDIMLQQIEKPSGIYVRGQTQNSSHMKEFDVSDYVSVNIDAMLQVGNIIPPQVVEWWKGYFKKVYDDFHKVAMACYNRDVMFQEQLKVYAENIRTLLVVTSCNTINTQVQSAVMQMREIVQTSKDVQNAAVVVVASRTKELADLQQKLKCIRLSQQAASIFPISMFKTYQTVADLQSDTDIDIWDVMRTAAVSELATAAWEEAITTSSWSAELLPEVCIGGGVVINHNNIMKIENDMLLSDIEIYVLLATAAASPRISNGHKAVVLSSQTIRDAYMKNSSSNSSSSSSNRTPFSSTVTAKLSDADSVLFAVNTDTYGSGIHWVLGVFEPKQSRLLMFDSMEEVSAISHLQSIKEVLQQVYQKELILESVALDQQSDQISCGYHVVINGIRYMHYKNINYCSDYQSRKLTKVLAKVMVGFWVERRKPECVNVFEQLVDNLMDTAKQQLQSKLPTPIIKELDNESDVLLDTESKMESLFGWMVSQIKSSQTEQQQQQQHVLPTPAAATQPFRRSSRRSSDIM